MKLKYKVGDKVKVLVGRYKDNIGTIEQIDTDWMYPYELSGMDELYGEDELVLVTEDEIHVATESEPEPDGDAEDSDYYLIVYNGDNGRTIMFAPNEDLLLDDKYDVDPKENPYIQGFFDGLSYAGVTFVIKLQYLT